MNIKIKNINKKINHLIINKLKYYNTLLYTITHKNKL